MNDYEEARKRLNEEIDNLRHRNMDCAECNHIATIYDLAAISLAAATAVLSLKKKSTAGLVISAGIAGLALGEQIAIAQKCETLRTRELLFQALSAPLRENN